MTDLRAYILCHFAAKSGVYTSWMDQAPLPTTVIDEYLPDWQVPDDAGILITHMHYRWEDLAPLRKAFQQNRIPILILSDGILEYRNTWEHPDLANGSMFQPLFGHKLACIGRGQARVVESWGNPGRCEVVGLPRLDQVDLDSIPPVNTSGPFRILVATAKTPAFDEQQRKTVVDSLNCVKGWLEKNPLVGSRPIEVTWRLTGGLETEIGVGHGIDPEDWPPIEEVIDRVDAVITTPSTILLESVLRKRPTALLDFHNRPHYVTAAWTINAPEQLGETISELASPPKHKMMFQEIVLHDQLECQSPATPRLLELIVQMVEFGKKARAEGQTIELPARMLTDPQHGFSIVPDGFSLANLYPDDKAFENQDMDRLRIELAAAVKRLEQLPSELAEKNKYIAELIQLLDRLCARVKDMHGRVVKIRERFGIEPAKPKVDSCDIVKDD